jgi:hypothetical protein
MSEHNAEVIVEEAENAGASGEIIAEAQEAAAEAAAEEAGQ